MKIICQNKKIKNKGVNYEKKSNNFGDGCVSFTIID